jgi:putative ABC transport system permease protein
MMRLLNQIFAVTLLNIKNLPQRAGASLVAVIGVAAVVLVFAAVLSMAKGFERTMVSAGSDDIAVILRSGSTSEMSSGLSNDQALIVANAPGVLKDGNTPLVSAELFVIVDVRKKSNDADANVPFRGVQPSAFDVRRYVRIIEGRMFETGKNEILVGRAAQSEFRGLDVGSTIRFGQTDWTVVGAFEAGGGVSESELWTDVRVLQAAYRRGNSFQVVRVKLESPASLETLEAALKDDPRIDPDVMSEREFYSSQAQGMTQFIKLVGYPLTILMSIGAVFGALNSMYSSVSVRGKEIATLRALGFGPVSVLVSTIVESTLLASIGGLLGGALAFLVFNGFQVSTLNSASFSQVVFDFAVTGELLAQGLRVALVIGVVGGFFPAIRAARMPVAQALREL